MISQLSECGCASARPVCSEGAGFDIFDGLGGKSTNHHKEVKTKKAGDFRNLHNHKRQVTETYLNCYLNRIPLQLLGLPQVDLALRPSRTREFLDKGREHQLVTGST